MFVGFIFFTGSFDTNFKLRRAKNVGFGLTISYQRLYSKLQIWKLKVVLKVIFTNMNVRQSDQIFRNIILTSVHASPHDISLSPPPIIIWCRFRHPLYTKLITDSHFTVHVCRFDCREIKATYNLLISPQRNHSKWHYELWGFTFVFWKHSFIYVALVNVKANVWCNRTYNHSDRTVHSKWNFGWISWASAKLMFWNSESNVVLMIL